MIIYMKILCIKESRKKEFSSFDTFKMSFFFLFVLSIIVIRKYKRENVIIQEDVYVYIEKKNV